MSGVVRVVPEDLTVSAARVDAHADNLRQRHGTADAQIESANPGLPTGSAAALNGAVAKWQEVTAAHYTSMFHHSTALRSGAAAYEEVDTRSAENFGGAVPRPDLDL